MNAKNLLAALGLILLVGGCTPKTVEQTQATPETKPTLSVDPQAEEENLSPCPKFSDASDPDEAETNYVLYRDFKKVENWEEAFFYWQKVYAVAPAADGKRNTIYADGIKFYEHFMAQTEDEAEKEAYIDKIFALYDEIDQCYSDAGFIAGRKAFDLYYKYPHRATKEEVYALFKKSVDIDGKESNDFVVNPFTSLLVEMYFDDKIPLEEAQQYDRKIKEIVAHGIADCKGRACERWRIVESYAPLRLEAFETVRGFYDCQYYLGNYYPEFEAAPDDCDVVREVYSRLKWGGCTAEDEKFKELIRIGNENCAPEPGPAEKAYILLRDADYPGSIDAFKKAIEEEEDVEKKAKYALIIAKIYNAHLKDFPKSRQWARKAAGFKPNWGEPFILIGRLYASSGPLCGPGRGWDSQIVTWPAIDMWNKAKRIDPGSAKEANKWIARYSKYMPSNDDVFMRNLKVGDSFRIGCWIQETTRIRIAK